MCAYYENTNIENTVSIILVVIFTAGEIILYLYVPFR